MLSIDTAAELDRFLFPLNFSLVVVPIFVVFSSPLTVTSLKYLYWELISPDDFFVQNMVYNEIRERAKISARLGSLDAIALVTAAIRFPDPVVPPKTNPVWVLLGVTLSLFAPLLIFPMTEFVFNKTLIEITRLRIAVHSLYAGLCLLTGYCTIAVVKLTQMYIRVLRAGSLVLYRKKHRVF